MIEEIIDFFFSVISVIEAAFDVVASFRGKRRGSRQGKDNEEADYSGHE